VVLDGVVRAAFEYLSDLGPFVVDDAVHQEKDPFFLFIPVYFFDARIQMIVPSLTALFPHATIQVLGNERPLLGSVGYHQLKNAPIFFGTPSAFNVEGLCFAF